MAKVEPENSSSLSLLSDEEVRFFHEKTRIIDSKGGTQTEQILSLLWQIRLIQGFNSRIVNFWINCAETIEIQSIEEFQIKSAEKSVNNYIKLMIEYGIKLTRSTNNPNTISYQWPYLIDKQNYK